MSLKALAVLKICVDVNVRTGLNGLRVKKQNIKTNKQVNYGQQIHLDVNFTFGNKDFTMLNHSIPPPSSPESFKFLFNMMIKCLCMLLPKVLDKQNIIKFHPNIGFLI